MAINFNIVDFNNSDGLAPGIVQKLNYNFKNLFNVFSGSGVERVVEVVREEIEPYTLPPATSHSLGGIRVGNNLTIDSSGVLSANASQYSLPTASANTLGGIKVGNNLSIDQNGVLSATGGGEGEPIAVGTIWPYAGSTEPDGFLFCNGQAVSRTDYSELFAVIGTTFGSGDGSTTFNVPDLRGRTPIGAGQGSGLTNRTLGTQNIGAESVTLQTSQIPSHNHAYDRANDTGGSTTLNVNQIPSHSHGIFCGFGEGSTGKDAFRYQMWANGNQGYRNSASGVNPLIQNTGGGQGHSHSQPKTSTNTGNRGDGGSHNNMQPSTVVNFIICAKGINGIKGDKGDKGDTGDTGATGATGPQGPQGEQGPKGDKGDTGSDGNPVGTIIDFAGPNAPTGYLNCDGSTVSRTTYAALFAVIGTTWGSGDGSTTFNLPNLMGRTTIGAGSGSGLTSRTLGTQDIGEETHTLQLSEMPSHRHSGKTFSGSAGSGEWSFASVYHTREGYVSTETSGEDQPHNNMQPSAVVRKLIKAE